MEVSEVMGELALKSSSRHDQRRLVFFHNQPVTLGIGPGIPRFRRGAPTPGGAPVSCSR